MNMSSVSVTTLLSFLGLTTRQCHSSSTSKAKWLIPDFSDCVTDKYESLFREVRDLLLGFFHVFFFKSWKCFYVLTKLLRFLCILGRETEKFVFLEPNVQPLQQKNVKNAVWLSFSADIFACKELKLTIDNVLLNGISLYLFVTLETFVLCYLQYWIISVHFKVKKDFELNIGGKLCNFISLCRSPSHTQDKFEKFSENLEMNLNELL